jgi:fatty acid amide hydrolase 2
MSAEPRSNTRRLLLLSATELARRIRCHEVSSEEVVTAHIDRVRQVNPTLNAMVCDRFDAALQEARDVDSRLRTKDSETPPPFLGVPFTAKEAFALTGMPNTSGLVSRRGEIACSDATVVTRLRRAGAIPIGVTNVSELCMYMESDNCVYGRTNNPYDPRRIPGGSSGGEGALIGAAASPFGLGSDIGGSIRLPAFFNGVFGHKPTGGLVPGSGQFPFATGAARRYLTTGPLARRAEDLLPLLRIMAGPDDHDTGCLPLSLPATFDVDLRSLEVIVVPDNGAIRVSPELAEAQARCADSLARRGARVRFTRIAALAKSFEIWSSMLSDAGGPSFASLMGAGQPIAAGREMTRWVLGRSCHTFPAIALALLEKLPRLAPSHAEKFVAAGRALRAELVETIGPRGVLLYPPYATTAPRHSVSFLPPFKWVYTAIFNAMELPVTQVPLGLDRKGLPLGVQVVGIHGNDALTISVARFLEDVFGGWVPPPEHFDAKSRSRPRG